MATNTTNVLREHYLRLKRMRAQRRKTAQKLRHVTARKNMSRVRGPETREAKCAHCQQARSSSPFPPQELAHQISALQQQLERLSHQLSPSKDEQIRRLAKNVRDIEIAGKLINLRITQMKDKMLEMCGLSVWDEIRQLSTTEDDTGESGEEGGD